MRNWLRRLLADPDSEEEPEQIPLREAIREAHKEWKLAQSLFDQVEEPELVDYAAHRLLAAQKRYTYLLKQQQHRETVALGKSAEREPGREG